MEAGARLGTAATLSGAEAWPEHWDADLLNAGGAGEVDWDAARALVRPAKPAPALDPKAAAAAQAAEAAAEAALAELETGPGPGTEMTGAGAGTGAGEPAESLWNPADPWNITESLMESEMAMRGLRPGSLDAKGRAQLKAQLLVESALPAIHGLVLDADVPGAARVAAFDKLKEVGRFEKAPPEALGASGPAFRISIDLGGGDRIEMGLNPGAMGAEEDDGDDAETWAEDGDGDGDENWSSGGNSAWDDPA